MTLLEVNIGRFINALLTFLIIAAVVYFFIVTPYNKVQQGPARRHPGTAHVHGGGGLD